MSNIKYKKGFTLIELLVVVAIIGILASVVLASLNSARSKGNDAKVKSQLASIRAAAEIYYTDSTGYGTASTSFFDSSNASCSGDMWSDISSGMKPLVSYDSYPSGTSGTCISSPTGWAVTATLSDNNSTNVSKWCVDSNGNSKKITSDLGSTVCPAS